MKPNSHIARMISLTLAGMPGLLSAWTPGTYPAGSSNFAVDPQSRNDVVAFWHGVYQASEGYQDHHGWTGDYTYSEGSMSADFTTDVERRLNYYRAMCKVPADTRVNTGASVLINAADPTNLYHPTSYPPLASATTKTAAAQRGAYMIIRTYGYSLGGIIYPGQWGGNPAAAMTHTPATGGCVEWSTAAWNANHHSNLALGFYGPGAVDAYMAEKVVNALSDWNSEVGHRRWALYPISTDFASGDTPGCFESADGKARPPSNALYVVPKATETVSVTPSFVAYPPAGYFPAALNSPYWSLSYPGAGFDSATVTMTTADGVPVPVTIRQRGGCFGYPAIVWQVTGASAATAVVADTRYNVSVSGMTGACVPTAYAYSVTLIDPNQLTCDQTLFGPDTPQISIPTTYQLTPPPHAEALQVNCFQPVSTAWTEGAEDTPTPGVIAHTASSYEFRSSLTFATYPGFGPLSGARSFRLTIPVWYDPTLNGVPEQSFELDRDILPGAAASLNFNFRRGYMTPGTQLVVESSSDGGVLWSQVGTTLTGNANSAPDTVFPSLASIPLAASAVPIRLRFRFFVPPGVGFYADQSYLGTNYSIYPTGIFIDDIHSTNCQWLDLKKSNELATTATSFDFNSMSAGMALTSNLNLRLRLRVKLGNRWMPYGPMKEMTLNTAPVTDMPAFNLPSGEYPAGQTITIMGESDSTICYRLNGGTEHSAPNPFSGITVPAEVPTLTITAYAKKAGKADSAVVSASYSVSVSPLNTWMHPYFPGVTDPDIIGPAADPDRDGQVNSIEFALGGSPNNSGDGAKIHQLTSDAADAKTLLMTIAVRAGTPAFTGSPSPMATHTQDGVTYVIQGGRDSVTFTSPVSSVVPALTSGLPAAPAGYEYRTFKLDDAAGLPDTGFLRVQVTTTH